MDPTIACFIAIMAWTDEGRIAKYAKYPTEAEASAHVERFSDQYPGAFVAPCRNDGSSSEWMIDPAKREISIVPLPPEPPPPPSEQEQIDELRQELDVLKERTR